MRWSGWDSRLEAEAWSQDCHTSTIAATRRTPHRYTLPGGLCTGRDMEPHTDSSIPATEGIFMRSKQFV